jgi:hypothetical protein
MVSYIKMSVCQGLLDVPSDALQKIVFSLTEKYFNNGTFSAH